MRYQYKDTVFQIRTLSELPSILSKTKVEFSKECFTGCETRKLLRLIYVGDNAVLADLLLQDFNIPTNNNFANRSAMSICTNVPPSKLYAPHTTPSLAEYIISLLKIVLRDKLHKYLRDNPITKPGWNDIESLDIPIFTIVNHVLQSYKIPQIHNITRYSMQPVGCGGVTRRNIESYFIRHGIIDKNTNALTDSVVAELDLHNVDFARKLLMSVCPKSKQGWVLTQDIGVYKIKI